MHTLMALATVYLVWGIVIHLVVDWLFQNAWMADNKANTRHVAGYVHAGLHGLALCLVFPPIVALTVAVLHWMIDLRVALASWRRLYRQTTDGPAALHVAIWGDQVVHIAVIALAALFMVWRHL